MITLMSRDAESVWEYVEELHALIAGDETNVPPWMTVEECIVYCIQTIRNIYKNA